VMIITWLGIQLNILSIWYLLVVALSYLGGN
jgi:hypothetical protein